MTWTPPRTWVAREFVDAAMMNTHVRDNLNHIRATSRCHVTASATQTITAAVIAWNTELYNSDTLSGLAMHSTSTNNERITIRTTGVYRFAFALGAGSPGGGVLPFIVELRKNGSAVRQWHGETGTSASVFQTICGECILPAVANDYFTLYIPTSLISILGGPTASYFETVRGFSL